MPELNNTPRKIGSSVFSFAVEIGDKKVQLDVMFVSDIEWAKFSYHADPESKYKSGVRNELLHAILKNSLKRGSGLIVKDEDGNRFWISGTKDFAFSIIGPLVLEQGEYDEEGNVYFKFKQKAKLKSKTGDVINVTVPQTNISGNFTVNGTTTNLNSTTVSIVDPIITLGTIANDTKDRGIEYRYFNTTSKLGYFGMDTTDKTFMYVPDAINTGEVITGALGNVKFADGSFTSLNLNNGVISKVNTLSSDVDLTISPGTTRNLIIDMDSGTDITIPEMVDLNFNASGTNKIYSDGTNLHLVNGAIVDGDTVINGSLTITGAVTFTGGTSLIYTVERISGIGGSSISPNINFNTTFISVTSTGTASGILPAHNTDGFVKNISIVSLVGNPAIYELAFPAGRLLDPGTGTTSAKKMIFNCPGQGVQLLWDNFSGFYVIINGGGELLPA